MNEEFTTFQASKFLEFYQAANLSKFDNIGGSLGSVVGPGVGEKIKNIASNKKVIIIFYTKYF